jgi:hypothetical protein
MNLLRSRSTRSFALAGLLLCGGVACNSTSATSYALGDVVAVVTDANGAPVAQVQVNLMLTDKATLWRTAVTGSDGKAQFGSGEGGVLVQDYLVFFPSQVQWKLADGETNYKPAKATQSQTVTVQFKVQKVVITPG